MLKYLLERAEGGKGLMRGSHRREGRDNEVDTGPEHTQRLNIPPRRGVSLIIWWQLLEADSPEKN